MTKQNIWTLPFNLVPSFNQILRMNRWDKAIIRDRVYGELLTQMKGKHKMQRCSVKFDGYLCKFRDWDGFHTGLKYVLDFMVLKKLIPDDSPKFVILESPEQIKVKKKVEQKFIITITEIT